MGDFDRTVAPGEKPSETKKTVAVLCLGAVLVVIVAMQMMKKSDGAQPVVGAPVASGVALPAVVVPDEISPNALARMGVELQNDPTKALLRKDNHEDRSLDVIPRNPFAMDSRWRETLINPVAVVSAGSNTKPAPDPVIPKPVPVLPPGVAPRAEDYKLSSIVNGNMAIINGRIVKAGDLVGKARVVEIHVDAVILQNADAPGGPTTELMMAPRLINGG